VVSSTGEVSEYVGGYSDIQQYLKAAPKAVTKTKPKDDSAKSAPAKRLTYNLQREWDELPKKIKVFEKRIGELEALLDDSTLYEKNPQQFKVLSEELQQNQEAVDTAETRWLELEMLADEMKG
jgi:ATP-binding cassette subfamily F protein uup